MNGGILTENAIKQYIQKETLKKDMPRLARA
jgi:hypothetical protein